MKTVIVKSDLNQCILSIRGHRVMIDHDLAGLYEVQTKALIQAVKRNLDRFPEDFMFQLNSTEAMGMRSQIVTASKRNIKHRPYAFTEQGVAMLSSVLRSQRATRVNVAIMRAFVRTRELHSTNENLSKKLSGLEIHLGKHDRRFKKHGQQIRIVFAAIRELMAGSGRKIGFQPG